jgi:DNA-binding XRE family transcriptional regulator
VKTVSQIKRKPKVRRAWSDKPVVFNTSALVEMRAACGLTLREVAGYSGVALATIDRMERGHKCELQNAMMLARFYEKPIEQLWSLKP